MKSTRPEKQAIILFDGNFCLSQSVNAANCIGAKKSQIGFFLGAIPQVALVRDRLDFKLDHLTCGGFHRSDVYLTFYF
jgi:hypothetical protein